MGLYEGSDFRTEISSLPAQVTLGGWVYAAVSLHSEDPDLKVVVNSCWATADEDPDSSPNYYMLRDKYVFLLPYFFTVFA